MFDLCTNKNTMHLLTFTLGKGYATPTCMIPIDSSNSKTAWENITKFVCIILKGN